MKSWTTPVPDCMAHLPKDPRGFPGTYTSIKLPDGRYDLTTADHGKWLEVVNDRLCALCGRPLRNTMWFIGGPKCVAYRFFFDPAMHEECAKYSFEVCPYLSLPGYLGAKKHLVSEEARMDIVSADKRKPVIYQGDLLVRANEWLDPPTWWKDGQQMPQGWTL